MRIHLDQIDYVFASNYLIEYNFNSSQHDSFEDRIIEKEVYVFYI